MTFEISYETDIKLEIDYEKIIKDAILASLDYEKCPYEAEVSVIITDDENIHKMNKEFRGIDRSTDVLSFPMNEFKTPACFDEEYEELFTFNPETGELLLGDIVLSVEHIKMQANEYGHSLERDLAFLVVHSMLHLMGYDHIEEKERVIMEQKQEQILDERGYHR